MSMCIYHGNLSLADAAYLAGLIDGEGSIAVSRTKTSASAKACKRGFAYRSSVTITMTDLPVLEWVKRVKAGQAENLIEFQGAMRQPGSKGLTDGEWASREAHYNKSQCLNQRGIAS